MVESKEPNEPESEDLSAILHATLALSQTQLLAQIADETSLDGRTMGLLGFNGALLAADIAAKDVLGSWWWAPLPFVAITTTICARSMFGKDTFLGPTALTFYTSYGGQSSILARKTLLADLDVAYKSNSSRAKQKADGLRWALLVLGCGLVLAASLIAFDRPSKVSGDENCTHTAPTACAAATRSGSGPLWAPASWAARHHRVDASKP
ncbi:MAG TPA: hypothetical protein VL988_10610 [Solirubrobacteraceae bacterium]|nr:hypothetical protein [Solirubrobacteraceae bacterium]